MVRPSGKWSARAAPQRRWSGTVALAMAAMRPSSARDPLAAHSLAPRELKALLAAERAEEPFLAFRDAAGQLKLYVLRHEDTTITVGRRHETDLSIPWDGDVPGLTPSWPARIRLSALAC